MSLKTRLSLDFSLLVAGILFFFSLLIYYLSYTTHRERFRSTLLNRAKNSAILMLNFNEIDTNTLKSLHQSTLRYLEEEIVITDADKKVIYRFNSGYLTDSLINNLRDEAEYSFFHIREKDGIHYQHRVRGKVYQVYLMAYDSFRREYMADLRKAFFWGILFSLLLSVVVSYFFSRIAIQPLTQIVKKIGAFNSTRLSERLQIVRKDEIGQLAASFNQMLDNLEVAFKNQEEFVSNASHELRTPLAVMIAEADYLLTKERTNDEYRQYITETNAELRKLNSLLVTLLELAHVNRDKAIMFTRIRIDEIVYNCVHALKSKYSGRKILTRIYYPENEQDLMINGNPGLLEIVVKNLLDNACKFSQEEVTVEIATSAGSVRIIIIDKGIGIPQSDIDGIFKPFNRATNARLKSGFGIGLYLVFIIMKLHAADIRVSSEENEGTQFELIFKNNLD